MRLRSLRMRADAQHARGVRGMHCMRGRRQHAHLSAHRSSHLRLERFDIGVPHLSKLRPFAAVPVRCNKQE